ncbi:unnamed protein product [marine sediment metagenome]|uniref:Uncharacterized protein n=1 Tax=marine sediment metagenome TaxID=412755 RepID=X1VA38_9ZZZZ
MSSNILEGVIVPDNMVRDFMYTHDGAVAAGEIHDVGNTFASMGLDLFVRNRGAAAITVAINGQPAVTVDPGDVYILNQTKFWLITVVSAVLYDFQIFGIKITTLKQRGLMK